MANRDLTGDFITAVTAGVKYPALLFDFVFDEGEINLFTGRGTLSWNGKTYTGSGDLLKVDPAQETQRMEATNTTYLLAASPELVALARTAEYQGRPAVTWLALFDAAGVMVDDPIRIASGKMDEMPIDTDPAAPTIGLTAEGDLITLTKASERRYTHEDQQIDYPGDLFFEFVTQMQDKAIVWGKT